MLSTFRNLFVQYTYERTHTMSICLCVCVCVCVIKLNTELPSVLSQKHSLATFTAPVATSILSDEFLLCVYVSVCVCVLCLGLFFLLFVPFHRVLLHVVLQAKLFSFVLCSVPSRIRDRVHRLKRFGKTYK